MSWFLCVVGKWLGFSGGIEFNLVILWVVEIHLISVWEIEIDLISVSGYKLT